MKTVKLLTTTKIFFLFSICILMPGILNSQNAPVFNANQNGAIKNWLLCAPFPVPVDEASGQKLYYQDFLTSIGGEKDCTPSEGTAIDYQGEKRYFELYKSPEDIVRLHKKYDIDYNLAYAYCNIESDKDQDVFFHVGADDGFIIYLNGEFVHEYHLPRGVRKNSDILKIHLKKGLNPIMVKCENGRGGWGFVIELFDFESHILNIADQVTIDLQQSGDKGENIVLRPKGFFDYNDQSSSLQINWTINSREGKNISQKTVGFLENVEFKLPSKTEIYEVKLTILNTDSPEKSQEIISSCVVSDDKYAYITSLLETAKEIISNPEKELYAGWISYKRQRLQKELDKKLDNNVLEGRELLGFVQAIEDAKNEVLKNKTGEFEWAYLSKVDRSGQPFVIRIPDTYTDQQLYPLKMVLHGAGGMHKAEGSILKGKWNKNHVAVNVLGRARSGGYTLLSETDVLECMDYVKKAWNINPKHVHIQGISMGGGGTFKISSRFPDRFSSANPAAGYGTEIDAENLLNLPVYSLHSIDDPTVPVTLSRIPLQILNDAGGKVVNDETKGVGHAIADYAEGYEAMDKWREKQIQPEKYARIHYTATDESASKAYWGKILRWGDRPFAATFDIQSGNDNNLYLRLANIGTLQLNLDESPLNRGKNCEVFVNSLKIGEISSPLPEIIYISNTSGGYEISDNKPKEANYRLHFPGGASSLYKGEPIMVVWGTKGDRAMNEALENTALMASSSTNPGWLPIEKNYPGWNMFFSRLISKPDTAVTTEDMANFNLLLLGTTETNTVIKKITSQLPIKVENDNISLNDGIKFPIKERAWGLLYYNPLSTKRLIYIASSNSPEFYKERAYLTRLHSSAEPSYDFTLMEVNSNVLVSGRCFNPDWEWEKGYEESEFLPEKLCSYASMNDFSGNALYKTSGSDFAVMAQPSQYNSLGFSFGESRWMDMELIYHSVTPVTITLSGSDFLNDLEAIKAVDKLTGTSSFVFYPITDSSHIDKNEEYKITFASPRLLSNYLRTLKRDMKNFDVAGYNLGEAMDIYKKYME